MLDESIKNQLVNRPLEYRPRLSIPKEFRFGFEIEIENIDYDKVYHLVTTQFGSIWNVKEDRSLIKGQNAEIATPVLENTTKQWLLLKKLSELITKLNPTFKNCSLQINVDGSLIPTIDDKINFLKFYAYYEDIVYRFSKGLSENYRDSITSYASPIILALKDTLTYLKKDKNLVIYRFSNSKEYGINYKTKNKDLIEFRTPNGTVDCTLWQNYMTFFYYLIVLFRSKKYNQKEIDDYIDSYSEVLILKSYEQANEEKAISLAKKMFNNQTDRIYFLQQYIGNR